VAVSFETVALALGALLMGGALVSGLVGRSFLSLTAIFVVVGFVLGDGALKVVDFDPRSGFVSGLATIALIVILFRDGLEVEFEMLQKQWRVPLRKLVVAMPLTAAIVAVTAHVLTDLSWTECFLLGALLSPTDPVLSNALVTNPKVPRIVRHSLNLESGLNDGLALPAVLALAAALDISNKDFNVTTFVLQDVGLGLLYGLVVGYAASRLMPASGASKNEAIPHHQKSLYTLGVAFATYGLTLAPPHANGFIAVYICAIVLGIRRPDLRHFFEERSEEVIEIAKLGVFVVFGSLLTFDGLFGDGLAAAAIAAVTLLIARPVAVWLALAGTRVKPLLKGFMAWFGPKGVATMTFSLIVLGKDLHNGNRIFNIAALTVFCSIIAHGLSDTPAVNWLLARGDIAEDDDGPTRTAASAAQA